MTSNKMGFKRPYKALLLSLKGLRWAYHKEEAFRQELLLTVVLFPLALYLEVTVVERILLIGTLVLVLIVELLNTAIECAIDRISLDRHKLSGAAKDLGSSSYVILDAGGDHLDQYPLFEIVEKFVVAEMEQRQLQTKGAFSAIAGFSETDEAKGIVLAKTLCNLLSFRLTTLYLADNIVARRHR